MAHHHHHPADAAHAHHGVGHIVSPKILIATAMALLVLTALTVLSVRIDFSEFDLPELNIFIALAIAVVKASLVCLFFMHLRWDRPFNAFVLVGSLGLVALFIAFAITDTTEYQMEVIKGDTPTVQAAVAERANDTPEEAGVAHRRTTNSSSHAGEP
jgi:cytochrome c oxidase subunit 4